MGGKRWLKIGLSPRSGGHHRCCRRPTRTRAPTQNGGVGKGGGQSASQLSLLSRVSSSSLCSSSPHCEGTYVIVSMQLQQHLLVARRCLWRDQPWPLNLLCVRWPRQRWVLAYNSVWVLSSIPLVNSVQSFCAASLTYTSQW